MSKPIRSGLYAAWLLSMGLVLGVGSPAWAKPSAKDTKVNAYVDIINSWSNTVYKTRANYAEWVASMKTGPTCKERNISGPGGIGDSAPADFKEYRKAIGKAPKLDADQAALQMVTALEELFKPQNEASEYYFKRKYSDDGCKRGKELHALLVAAWDKYAEGDRKLRAFVEQYNDERQTAELADAQKKYGKKLHYHHLKLSMDAKAVVRAIDAAAEAPKPDLSPLRTVLGTFEQTLTDTKALVAKEKGGKNSDALYQGGYEQMVKYADWFREAVGQFIKTVDSETKAPPPPKPDPKSKGGSKTPPRPATTSPGARERDTKQAIEAYNTFVDQSNKTMFSKGMK